MTITAAEVTVELRGVRLADRRLAGPVPPGLEPVGGPVGMTRAAGSTSSR